MLTRYWDRRQFIRIPASGSARWQSNGRTGVCEVVDVSPGGVGIRVRTRHAGRLGPRVTITVDGTNGEAWCLARDAQVVRRTPENDGMCRVGVAAAVGEDAPPVREAAGASNGGGGCARV